LPCRSHGCSNRLWHRLGFDWPDTIFGRSFNCILYCGLLPFPAEQNVGVPLPAKRLYQATYTIFRGRRCQLRDHHHDRPSLPVDLHHQRLNRQAIRSSSRHFGCVSFNAVFCVSKVALLPVSFSCKKKISHGGHGGVRGAVTTSVHDLQGQFGEEYRHHSCRVAPETHAGFPTDPIAR
jgi:hypothetical protein